MNLQTAFHAAKSALLVNASLTATVSRNIAGASETGYARRLTLVETNGFGGVQTAGVERTTDTALRNAMLSAQSDSGRDSAKTAAFSALAQTIGDPASGQSPAALIGDLSRALIQAASSPQDQTGLIAGVQAAKKLVQALNAGAAATQATRLQADSEMGAAVDKVNSLLSQFSELDTAIVMGKRSGANISDALDRRDSVLSDLSAQIGVSTVTGADGDMSVYTDSGVTLFQGGARKVTFQPSTALAAGVSGAAVYADGVAITGASAAMPIQSGALAGLSEVRDVIAPKYQAQLDEAARGLVLAFGQKDQSGASLPDRTGLFTWSGQPSLPLTTSPGLSAAISIDPSVDVAAGGNASLLRDGGIGGGAQPAYVYNSSGATSFSSRLLSLADALGGPGSFDPAAGLPTGASVTGFATASAAWLEAGRQTASDAATQSSALSTQAGAALSNATGVNIDDQMSRMLDLENSYQAAAKMMATVDAMYTVLFNAIPANA